MLTRAGHRVFSRLINAHGISDNRLYQCQRTSYRHGARLAHATGICVEWQLPDVAVFPHVLRISPRGLSYTVHLLNIRIFGFVGAFI